MTGICGLLGSSDDEIVRAMLGSLEHRGNEHQEFFSDGEVLLGSNTRKGEHRSSAMHSIDGFCAIMDGRLENREELVSHLERSGHRFQVGLGPEILIHAFEESGEGFADMFRGAFAFALWSGRELFLGRDRLGMKPLFFAHVSEDGLFLFSSEMKAILQHDFLRNTNTHAFCQRALIHHIIGNATSLKEIHQVPPGQTLAVNLGGTKGDVKIDEIKNRELAFNPNHKRSEERTVSLLIELLSASIADFGDGDGQPPVFLSGGIDSSLLVGTLDEISATPVETFTFSDDDSNPDILHAREVSSEFSTRHTEVIWDPETVVEELPNIVVFSEGLFGGFSLYLASKEVRERMPGITAAFTGEGPDELFGGYRYFTNMSEYIAEIDRRLKELGPIEETGPIRSHVKTVFSRGLESFLLDDIGDQLTNSHLLWADHCGMASGIGISSPYLSEDVVDLALTIPLELKVRKGIGKHILRKVAERFLPKKLERIIRRKKIGAPNATSKMVQRMRRLSEEMISDRYFRRHKYRRFVEWKLNMLMLDLFEHMFVEHNGAVPSGFEVSDLY